jgi:glucose-1-phosphate cytidylyltransferase
VKTVILAGGLGSRLSEETTIRPKPLVEVGQMPILWHIMNIYAAFGEKEFIVALGYRGDLIKDFFERFHKLSSDLTFRFDSGQTVVHSTSKTLDWTVHLVDTGSKTMTGGRLMRLVDWLKDDSFMLTYGDGVANVDIAELKAFHKRHGKLATVTAARPPARFGSMSIEGDRVEKFAEKHHADEGWINAGFFVLEPKVLDFIDSEDTIWERGPMERLAEAGQLMAYRHSGFWQPMDTLREKEYLNDLWASGQAPWKVWR